MAIKLILASGSPRRGELLKRLGLKFTIVPSKIDESRYDNLPPIKLVQQLSRAKAEEVAGLVEETVVIGADTVVVLDGKIMGKPNDRDEAVEMLSRLQGKTHSVLTGLAVCETNSNRVVVDYDQTEVSIRMMERSEIEQYVRTGEPMDKAGAYGIQGLGSILIDRIEGSFFTVMGLPVHKLALMLKGFSINIL